MIRIRGLLPAVLSLFMGSVQAQGSPPGPHQPEWEAVVRGNNDFTFDLYAALREHREGNVFFSPISVHTALAMVYAGARGETESQMSHVLHFPPGQEHIHPAFRGLIKELTPRPGQDGYEFHLANRLWARRDDDFLPPF